MEYVKFAFSGVNILPSIMLCIVTLYWLMAIFGSLAMHMHFKIDLHLDSHQHGEYGHVDHSVAETLVSSSLPIRILRFMNIGSVPITVYITILSLAMWIIAMLAYFLPIKVNSIDAVFYLTVNFFVSLIITKLVTEPMKGFFVLMESEKNENIEGEFCILRFAIDEKNIGQAEVEGKIDILINVVSESGRIEKGERAFIVEKKEDEMVYIVRRQ